MQIFPGLTGTSGEVNGQQKTEKKSKSDMFSLLLGRIGTQKTAGKKGDVAGKLQAENFASLSSKKAVAKDIARLLEKTEKVDAVQKAESEDKNFVSSLSFFLNLLSDLRQPKIIGKPVSKTGQAGLEEGSDSLSQKELYQGVLAEIRLLLRKKGVADSSIKDLLADLEQANQSVTGKISSRVLKEKILAAWKGMVRPENHKTEPEKSTDFKSVKNRGVEKKGLVAQGKFIARKTAPESVRGKTDAESALYVQGRNERVTNSALKTKAGMGAEQTRPETKKSAKSGQAASVQNGAAKSSDTQEHRLARQKELLGDIKSSLQQVLLKGGVEASRSKQLSEQIIADLRQLRFTSHSTEDSLQEPLVSLREIGRLVNQEKGGKVKPKMPQWQKADKQADSGLEVKEAGPKKTQSAKINDQAAGAEEKENLFAGKAKKDGEVPADQPGLAKAKARQARVRTGTDNHQAEAGAVSDTKTEKKAAVKADGITRDQRLAGGNSGTEQTEKKQTVLEPDAVQRSKDGQPVPFASVDSHRKKMTESEQAREQKTDFRLQTRQNISVRNIEDMSSGNFNDQENFSSSRQGQDMFAPESGRNFQNQSVPTSTQSFRMPAHPVARQIEQAAFRNIQPGTRQLVLQLEPVALGSVMVMLRVNKDKEVHAVLRAGSQEAARVIGEQAQQLRQSLEAQGLKVSRLEVRHDTDMQSGADFGPSQQNRQENGAESGFKGRFAWRNQRSNGMETNVSAVLEHELQHTAYQENFSSGVDIFA